MKYHNSSNICLYFDRILVLFIASLCLFRNIQTDCDEQVGGMTGGQTGIRNKTETDES